jgi:hypothetical protein
MFEIEAPVYAVASGKNVTVRIVRHGGTNGMASVTFQTIPGTAVDGSNFVDVRATVAFEDGENLQTVVVQTIGGKKLAKNLTFWGDLVAPENGTVLGIQKRTTITIMDVSERVENIVKGMAIGQKSEDFMMWIVLIVCSIVVCGVVWCVFNRRSVATSDELTSLIHGQRLYVV